MNTCYDARAGQAAHRSLATRLVGQKDTADVIVAGSGFLRLTVGAIMAVSPAISMFDSDLAGRVS